MTPRSSKMLPQGPNGVQYMHSKAPKLMPRALKMHPRAPEMVHQGSKMIHWGAKMIHLDRKTPYPIYGKYRFGRCVSYKESNYFGDNCSETFLSVAGFYVSLLMFSSPNRPKTNPRIRFSSKKVSKSVQKAPQTGLSARLRFLTYLLAYFHT